MRVLVTRPLHSGERTAERLRGMGHEPVLLPLSQPQHDPDAALRGLTQTDGPVAITSAEAIRAIAHRGAERAPHLGRTLFAVGEATGSEARAAGFRSVISSSGGGAALAETIARQALGPILYLAGSPRAETFERRASDIGLKLVVTECYRMEPVEIDPATLRMLLTERRPHAILLYSRQTAESFFSNPEILSHSDTFTGIRFLCISKSVSEAVPASLQQNIAIATMPEERSLLSLI
jgi:uroporphyrinogen-III synthase